LVTEVSGNVVAERSKLESMARFLSKSSPQYRAQAARVSALQAQLAGQSSRLAGPGASIASNLGSYEDLMVRKEFATQRYTVAAAAYESAKRKQQLYLTGVVAPNLPVKSEFPERGRIIMTVFFALLMAYAIGWLLTAGIKEHSL
jgi:capsular polysaccharide transport system permease protein